MGPFSLLLRVLLLTLATISHHNGFVFAQTIGCNRTVKAKAGDTCATIAAANGITVSQFLQSNPGVTSCSQLTVGYDYCVEGTFGTDPPAPTGPANTVSIDGTCGKGVTFRAFVNFGAAGYFTPYWAGGAVWDGDGYDYCFVYLGDYEDGDVGYDRHCDSFGNGYNYHNGNGNVSGYDYGWWNDGYEDGDCHGNGYVDDHGYRDYCHYANIGDTDDVDEYCHHHGSSDSHCYFNIDKDSYYGGYSDLPTTGATRTVTSVIVTTSTSIINVTNTIPVTATVPVTATTITTVITTRTATNTVPITNTIPITATATTTVTATSYTGITRTSVILTTSTNIIDTTNTVTLTKINTLTTTVPVYVTSTQTKPVTATIPVYITNTKQVTATITATSTTYSYSIATLTTILTETQTSTSVKTLTSTRLTQITSTSIDTLTSIIYTTATATKTVTDTKTPPAVTTSITVTKPGQVTTVTATVTSTVTAAPGGGGNGNAPGPVVPGTSKTCKAYDKIVNDDNCRDIANRNGLLLLDFYKLNPSIDCDNLWAGYYVCTRA
ncbi:hypothetical protein SMACR_03082 [Sordaria macrospora]|uniref:WGS project CABT00000000 data, contig 2.7 n=2 Tax=Sordaria macrospora TaxID=5147 RepID=F7VUA1_SORMK|nr:uncharacterized protein SMAC_03082 [Sordaria macrospora k-hell]KAA8632499.1 hypothetical protein SMACR_03082 [Sordaria macrospora]WPJ61919.1 hypothetical protein SMAC4_03082 [Sordaria macrospora]CCC09089.1 unnamed protein product [Sordaria macrospora k-hell]